MNALRKLDVSDVAKLLRKELREKFPSAKFRATLTECAILERDFWLQLRKRKTLRWAKPNTSDSEYNIRRICEYLGIPA